MKFMRATIFFFFCRCVCLKESLEYIFFIFSTCSSFAYIFRNSSFYTMLHVKTRVSYISTYVQEITCFSTVNETRLLSFQINENGNYSNQLIKFHTFLPGVPKIVVYYLYANKLWILKY